MPLTTAEKSAVIDAYGSAAGDTGSAAVQTALLTNRIQRLTEHFKLHRQDNHSRHGLLRLVSKRRRHLRYLRRTRPEVYQALIKRLGLRH